MNFKHTPGPWFVDTDPKDPLFLYVVHGRGNNFGWICRISTNGNVNAVRDAKVIAAAPELLASLKSVHRELRKSGWDMEQINAALNKAGEPT